MSCRVCLQSRKPKKLRSILVDKFDDNEVISDVIHEISGIRVSILWYFPLIE